MDDAHAAGQRRGCQRMTVQSGADAEDQVGLGVQEMRAMAGEAVAAGTERQRVVLGEGALAVHRRHHRALQQLRQPHQFVARLGVEHTLAGEDHRARRVQQQTRGFVHVVRCRRTAGRADRSVIQRLAADVEVQHIARQFHHHRSRPPVLQLTERTAHRGRHLFGHQNLLGLLGDRGIGAACMKHRKHLRLLARVAERQEQYRHRIRIRGGNSGEGVLRARSVLHGEHAGRFAIGDAGIPVGHIDAHALLAADDRTQPAGHRGLDHRRGWEAEQRGHALALEDLHDGIGCAHLFLPFDVWRTLGAGRRTRLQSGQFGA